MHPAQFILLALAGLTPVLWFVDGPSISSVVGLFGAAALGAVVVSIRPGEAEHVYRITRWIIVLALIPLVWILIQFLPLPIGTLSHSLWSSADETLQTSISSHVTIDPGLTLVALFTYLSLLTIGFSVVAVSVDRLQAERLFLVLGCATAVLSLILIVYRLGGFGIGAPSDWAAAQTTSAFGTIISANIIILMVERQVTRRGSLDARTQFYWLLASVVGFVLCGLAVIIDGSNTVLFATGCGLATVSIVYLTRRIGLGWRAAAGMAAVALIAAGLIASARAPSTPVGFTLRYADAAEPASVAVANRIIGEVGLGGSGVGTYRAVYHLYAAQDAIEEPQAPTFAAQLAVEMGRPMLWVLIAAAIALIIITASGAFSRGRDIFYPMAGAGVTVAAVVLAFANNSLGSVVVEIVLISTLGLALAQRVSRTS